MKVSMGSSIVTMYPVLADKFKHQFEWAPHVEGRSVDNGLGYHWTSKGGIRDSNGVGWLTVSVEKLKICP